VKRIDVTIDRVVLRGIDPANRQALMDGLQTELARILAAPGVVATPRHTPTLRLGRLPMETGQAGAAKLGQTVARAIGKGLKP
jgi:hypothetical protein